MKQYPPDDTEPTPEWMAELDKIDRQYYEDPGKLSELLNNYAEATGLIQPFKLDEKSIKA